MIKTCLITGANGFVGQALCHYLWTKGLHISATTRQAWLDAPTYLTVYQTGDIDGLTDWSLLHQKTDAPIDAIIHLASTVHQPKIEDPNVYQRSIVDATDRLAQQAIAAKVKKFIYVSSQKVYGLNASDKPIHEEQVCAPDTPYGIAKLAAERGLQKRMETRDMDIVIVRPPLIYGKNVRGNFQQLIQLVNQHRYLPLGCATKPRSFVGIHNFCSFLYTCLQHPKSHNQIFNISDDEDLSTRQLCEKLAIQSHQNPIFLPIPTRLMKLALTLCGKQSLYPKLFESVCLDIQRAKQLLEWRPVKNVDEELQF